MDSPAVEAAVLAPVLRPRGLLVAFFDSRVLLPPPPGLRSTRGAAESSPCGPSPSRITTGMAKIRNQTAEVLHIGASFYPQQVQLGLTALKRTQEKITHSPEEV